MLIDPQQILLYIAPLLRYLSGPLLGPERLHAMVPQKSKILDINAHILHAFMKQSCLSDTPLGDHSKPDGSFQEIKLWMSNQVEEYTPYSYEQIETMHMSFAEISETVELLSNSPVADFLVDFIPSQSPKWIGISILFSGQTLFSMLLANLFRKKHPKCTIIVGGAHITALQSKIENDTRYGEFFDGFVFGPAEKTFLELVQMNNPIDHKYVYTAGTKNTKRAIEDINTLTPKLPNIHLYGIPSLSIPIQLSRGCAYGQCSFCTYPSTEGHYRPSNFDGMDEMIELASSHQASLVFKDSYVVPKRIKQFGEIINGRVHWAICTRLDTRFKRSDWELLDKQGLRTIEIGLESISSTTLQQVNKHQKLSVLYELFENLRNLNIHLVLNLMTGFPRETYQDWAELNKEIKMWENKYKDVHFSVEKNIFQLEEGSEMEKNASQYEITIHKSFPWTTVCQWDHPKWVMNPEVIQWQGHSIRREK